jgi:hypothetical protein
MENGDAAGDYITLRFRHPIRSVGVLAHAEVHTRRNGFDSRKLYVSPTSFAPLFPSYG